MVGHREIRWLILGGCIQRSFTRRSDLAISRNNTNNNAPLSPLVPIIDSEMEAMQGNTGLFEWSEITAPSGYCAVQHQLDNDELQLCIWLHWHPEGLRNWFPGAAAHHDHASEKSRLETTEAFLEVYGNKPEEVKDRKDDELGYLKRPHKKLSRKRVDRAVLHGPEFFSPTRPKTHAVPEDADGFHALNDVYQRS